jgi:hypothetical protein
MFFQVIVGGFVTFTFSLSTLHLKVPGSAVPVFFVKMSNISCTTRHSTRTNIEASVAEPHHFYAAPAPSKNFDAAPAPALAPTLLYSKAKFLKLTKVYTHVETILFL